MYFPRHASRIGAAIPPAQTRPSSTASITLSGRTAYNVIAKGLLTGKYGPGGDRPSGLVRRMGRAFGEQNLEKTEPVVNILREIGEAHDKEPAQVALNWLITQRSTFPIPGAKNEHQRARTRALWDGR